MSSLKGKAYFSRGFDTTAVKDDLTSQTEERQLTALHQVIAYMTVGKDMSGLFNEVSAITSSTNVLMKRMCYLYLIQNAKAAPEKAVLQAGTFVKDTLHDSPLVRGAALRTLTLLQLPVMADFATGPLRRCLGDTDPYVRRTAALGVLKYFCSSSSALLEVSLLEKLAELLHDENHAVAAACVSAVLELIARNASPALRRSMLEAQHNLVERLSESNEWSAQQLLEGIAFCIGQKRNGDVVSAQEWLSSAEEALDSVIPFVFNDNLALAMSALKVLTMYVVALSEDPEYAQERQRVEKRFATDIARAIVSKAEAPRYEQRYILLRNVQLYLQTALFRPYFEPHLVSFLIKYDDPVFVKLEKLAVLVELANESNGQKVLNELTIYAKDGDADLSRVSIRSIGIISGRVPTIAADCVMELQKLIKTRVPRIVENSAIVVHTIMRSFPGKYDSIVPTLCEALTVLDDVDAKAAVVWIIGECAEHVRGAISDYLPFFLEDYLNQPRLVQVGVLTALTKLYLRGGDASSEALTKLEEVVNMGVRSPYPDLRDRSFFYARLLTLDRTTAKQILEATESIAPPHTARAIERAGDMELLSELCSLVSVEHTALANVLGSDAIGSTSRYLRNDGNLSDDEEDDEGTFPSADPGDTLSDVHGSGVSPTSASPSGGRKEESVYEVVIPAENGSGLEVSLLWSQIGTHLTLTCRFQLYPGEDHVKQVRVRDLQLRRNMFSLGIGQPFPVFSLEAEDKPADVHLRMAFNNQREPTSELQVAVDIEPIGVLYAVAPPVPPAMLLLPATGVDHGEFLELMQQNPTEAWHMPAQISKIKCAPSRLTVHTLRVHSFELVYSKEFYNEGVHMIAFFLHAETTAKQPLLIEITIDGEEVIWASVRSPYAPIAAFFGEYVLKTLRHIGDAFKNTR